MIYLSLMLLIFATLFGCFAPPPKGNGTWEE